MNQEHWEYEYNRYKQSPEFKMLNSHMDLEDFKQIYWMEWGHRLWGRVVGITFLLPTIYFVARKQVSKPMAWRLGGICGLIGMQGVIGWWMVKSGLKDELLETGNQPRVSQYRLATHLGTAFVAYTYMLWNGLAILRQHRLLADPIAAHSALDSLSQPALRPFRLLTAGLAALVFTTAMSGALVAGLDAGMIYNDFPWMGQNILPPKREMLDPFYSRICGGATCSRTLSSSSLTTASSPPRPLPPSWHYGLTAASRRVCAPLCLKTRRKACSASCTSLRCKLPSALRRCGTLSRLRWPLLTKPELWLC
jgi:cytochrome c oxidase assembly protein subunit 15